MSRRRNVYLKVRLTAEESQRLMEVAQQWGYKTSAEFVRASLGKQGQLTEEVHGLEKRQAATMTAVRTEIARLQRTEYVLFAMLENLAKTILDVHAATTSGEQSVGDCAREVRAMSGI